MIIHVIIGICIIAFICYYIPNSLIELKCPWHIVNQKRVNKSTKGMCYKLIDGIEKMNINYFIGFGTLLQAYRDGDIDYKDHDLDIMIPIWLNRHIFGCNEYKPVNSKKYNNVSVKLTNNYQLCNKNFSYYQRTFEQYVRSLKIKEVKFVVRYTRNTCVYLAGLIDKIYIDTWLMISNEFAYRDIDICDCELCGRMVKCLRNPIPSILIDYGYDWMIPKSKASAASILIDSVD